MNVLPDSAALAPSGLSPVVDLVRSAALSPQDVPAALRSSAEGLATGEAARRLVASGPNEIAAQGKPSWLAVLWGRTANPLNALLFGLATVSCWLGDLRAAVVIAAMVVLGGLGHLPGVILGAILLSALPEVLRYVAGPLQALTDGRLDAAILRQLLIALAMITIMLMRPRGLWPSPDHGKSLLTKEGA